MDFSDEIEILLQNKDYDKLLKVVFEPENIPKIQNFGMDLITRICEFGIPFCPEMDSLRACQDMLMHVVRCVRPKEALISLLEQAEMAVHTKSNQFSSLLAPLQFVMINLPKKREHTFSWVLSILNSHVKSQHSFPNDLRSHLIQGNAALLMEENPQIKDLLGTYQEYCNFYEPFIRQFWTDRNAAMSSNDAEAMKSINRQQEILRDHLVQLLGDPLVHIDLHWEETKSDASDKTSEDLSCKIVTDARIVSERLMGFLLLVDQHPEYYYKWVSKKMFLERSTLSKKPIYCGDDDDNDDTDSDEFIVDFSSVINYNYLIFCESMNSNMIPSVLSPAYLFLSAVRLMSMSNILSDNKPSPISLLKCFSLAHTLLSKIDPSVPGIRLETELLETVLISDFIESVAYHTVYSEFLEIRKKGLQVLKEIMWKLEPRGRYDFILFVHHRIQHDGIKGYITTQLKDCVRTALDTKDKNMLEFFTGKFLLKQLQLTCSLKEGITTDLMENSERIVSALNLILYLVLRDKNDNSTGIFEALPEIERRFLNPLYRALELSRAHYQLKLKELDDHKTFAEKLKEQKELTKRVDMVLNDNVQTPEDLKACLQEQRQSLNHALYMFDLMNGVLARANEACESLKKFKIRMIL